MHLGPRITPRITRQNGPVKHQQAEECNFYRRLPPRISRWGEHVKHQKEFNVYKSLIRFNHFSARKQSEASQTHLRQSSGQDTRSLQTFRSLQ